MSVKLFTIFSKDERFIFERHEEFGSLFEVKIIGKLLIGTEKGAKIALTTTEKRADQSEVEFQRSSTTDLRFVDPNLIIAFALKKLNVSDFKIDRISEIHSERSHEKHS